MMMTRDELLDFAYEVGDTARSGSVHLDPQEDWPPALFFIDRDGDRGVMVAPQYAVPHLKSLIVMQMSMVLAQSLAQAGALVFTAWHTRADRCTTAEFGSVRPSEHPDRYEVVFVVAFSASDVVTIDAQIGRRPDAHPLLADWEPMPDDVAPVGAFEPLQEVLRIVESA